VGEKRGFEGPGNEVRVVIVGVGLPSRETVYFVRSLTTEFDFVSGLSEELRRGSGDLQALSKEAFSAVGVMPRKWRGSTERTVDWLGFPKV
jgi:hypothetical protein